MARAGLASDLGNPSPLFQAFRYPIVPPPALWTNVPCCQAVRCPLDPCSFREDLTAFGDHMAVKERK